MTKICFNAYNKEHFLAICRTYKIRDTRIGQARNEWWFNVLMGPAHTWFADTEKYGLTCHPITIKEAISGCPDYVAVSALSLELGRM